VVHGAVVGVVPPAPIVLVVVPAVTLVVVVVLGWQMDGFPPQLHPSSTRQSVVHPSSGVPFPSSHSSQASTAPLPHDVSVLYLARAMALTAALSSELPTATTLPSSCKAALTRNTSGRY